MTLEDLFRRVVDALDQAGIPYMVTGSFAGAYHGTPRATQDIDLVIEAQPGQLRRLVALLQAAGYYADEGAALEAHALGSQFNAIDPTTGWKIDFMLRKARPFSLAEFARRQAVPLQGLSLFVASVEDVLLAKMEWAKLGGSQRQLEDVAALLRVRRADLDLRYLAEWIRGLGLEPEWARARQFAGWET